MQYALLIHESESVWDSYSEAQQGKIMAGYGSFSEHLQKNQQMLGGERLQPSHTATTVRVRDGKVALTDGPFTETKEQLGGFYLIEAKDLDEATRLAAMIPTAEAGSVEVRPIWTMSDTDE